MKTYKINIQEIIELEQEENTSINLEIQIAPYASEIISTRKVLPEQVFLSNLDLIFEEIKYSMKNKALELRKNK